MKHLIENCHTLVNSKMKELYIHKGSFKFRARLVNERAHFESGRDVQGLVSGLPVAIEYGRHLSVARKSDWTG